MGKKRNYSREYKISIIQQLETKKISQVCRENNLHYNIVHRWKKEYNQNPSVAFTQNDQKNTANVKIIEYERLLGELYAENKILKNAFESMKQYIAEKEKKKSSD